MGIIDGPGLSPLPASQEQTYRECPCCESSYGEHDGYPEFRIRKCRHCAGEGKVPNCTHCGGAGYIDRPISKTRGECPECKGEGYHANDLRCDADDGRDAGE